MEDFYGNADVVETLEQMIRGQRITQTLLFSGPEGVGKATLARRFAAALLKHPELIEKVVRINAYHMQQFAYFLGKLKSTPDGDGTLLDHSQIVYGSGLSDGNRHAHNNLPILLAGKSGGRHITYPEETPMNNLHLALLDRMGVQIDSLGDSNGELFS